MLTGDELLTTELWVRTCIELTKYFDLYIQHPDIVTKKLPTLDEKSFYSHEALYDVAVFGKKAGSVFMNDLR